MAHQSESMSPPRNDKRLSQAIFIAVGIAIIAAGLWFLYQTSAPYHPEVSHTGGEIHVATDG